MQIETWPKVVLLQVLSLNSRLGIKQPVSLEQGMDISTLALGLQVPIKNIYWTGSIQNYNICFDILYIIFLYSISVNP